MQAADRTGLRWRATRCGRTVDRATGRKQKSLADVVRRQAGQRIYGRYNWQGGSQRGGAHRLYLSALGDSMAGGVLSLSGARTGSAALVEVLAPVLGLLCNRS